MEILSLPQMVSVNALMIICKPLQGKGGLPGKWKEEELLLYLGFSRMLVGPSFFMIPNYCHHVCRGANPVSSIDSTNQNRKCIKVFPSSARCLIRGIRSVTDRLSHKGHFFLRWLSFVSVFFHVFVELFGVPHTHTFFICVSSRRGKCKWWCVLHVFPFSILTSHMSLNCNNSFYKICHNWFLQFCKTFLLNFLH